MFSNSARVGGDISPHWSNVMGMIDTDEPLAPYAGPGKNNSTASPVLPPRFIY
jgi:hypothetical protein